MNQIIVRPEGPLDATIAIIGEAPGEEEVNHNPPRPFIGPAGQLLDKILETVGINRSAVYISNVMKQRPGEHDNNIGRHITFNKNGSVTTSTLYDMYEKALWQELNMTKANVLVPLGNVSLYALTRMKAITKRRGSILSSQFVNRMSVDGTKLPRKVIATIHPSSVLRTHDYKISYLIQHDLARVLEESNSPELNLPKRSIITKPSYLEVLAYLDGLLQHHRLVAFDIEVLREELSCLSFATSPYNAISIPFHEAGRVYFSPEHELEVMRRIASVLEHPDIKKVGHNIFFDASFMYDRYGIRTANKDDTMVAFGILHPDLRKGLDFITTEYTREPYYKDDGKKYMRIGGNLNDFWTYNAKDSAVCLECFPQIMEDLRKFHNEKTYYRQVSLLDPLLFMYAKGLRMDHEGLQKASATADHNISLYQEKLDRVCGHPLNVNSFQQMQDYFYKEKGLSVYTKTVKKRDGTREQRVTLDIDALIRIARKGFPEARIVLDIRQERKMKSSYLDVKCDPDGRLRSAMNPVGTKNGRLSSSKTIFGTGLNIQTFPHEIRDYILPDIGYVAYEIDLSQAENRLVAYLAPEPSMIEAFERGKDVHSLTAGLIFGKDPAQVSDEEGSSTLGSGRFSERFWGKKANHSFNYGEGYKKFALQNEMPEVEAKRIWSGYHKVYPAIRGSYWAGVKTRLHHGRILTNPLSRSRIFLGLLDDYVYKDAYAFTPQSTVADIINEYGLLRTYHDQDIFWAVELLNQVHDSIWFQIPYTSKCNWDYHAMVLLALKNSLEIPLSANGYNFIIPADITMGTTFNSKGDNMKKVKVTTELTIDTLSARLEETYSCLVSKKIG